MCKPIFLYPSRVTHLQFIAFECSRLKRGKQNAYIRATCTKTHALRKIKAWDNSVRYIACKAVCIGGKTAVRRNGHKNACILYFHERKNCSEFEMARLRTFADFIPKPRGNPLERLRTWKKTKIADSFILAFRNLVEEARRTAAPPWACKLAEIRKITFLDR